MKITENENLSKSIFGNASLQIENQFITVQDTSKTKI